MIYRHPRDYERQIRNNKGGPGIVWSCAQCGYWERRPFGMADWSEHRCKWFHRLVRRMLGWHYEHPSY